MNVLLQMLRGMPEFTQLREAADARQTVAVSGVSQIVRSHFIAALCAENAADAEGKELDLDAFVSHALGHLIPLD